MSQAQMTGSDGMAPILRQARLAEAAHAEAQAALRDARSIRLLILKDEMAGLQHTLELVVVPGETPRLWIDLITSVVMEPDPRTYRLVQDRETVFETADRAEMAETLKRHIAHRIIARERQVAGMSRGALVAPGHSAAALIFAWTAGFAVGALALLIALILLGKLAN